jgi:hypothetical protein
MNIRRLILDTARRSWGAYATQIGIVCLFSSIANLAFDDGVVLARPSSVYALAMAVCWYLAFVPTAMLDAREIWRLPIARTDLWGARWWLGIAGPPAGLAIAFVLGKVTSTSGVSVELAVLSLLFCTLYNGCALALSAVFPLTAHAGGGWAVARILVRMLVLPLGGAALPLWFAK